MTLGNNVGNAPHPTEDIKDQFKHALHHYDEVLRSHDAPDMYIGGTYGQNGFQPNININQGGSSYTTPINSKPAAYSGNTAKTASSIAQGGMTKDEVMDFNMKHPNESAWRQS